MRNLTLATILLAVTTVASAYIPNPCYGPLIPVVPPDSGARCENYGPVLYQSFPVAWFLGSILLILGFRARREVEYELEQHRQEEKESREA